MDGCCPLCLEKFQEPKTLPCLHSFCQSCLQRHIDTELSGSTRRPFDSFSCPSCRRETKPHEPGAAVRGWALDFPTVFRITATMAGVSTDPCCEVHQDQKLQLFCDPCGRVICYQCFYEGHKSCDPVRPLQAAAESRRREGGSLRTGLVKRMEEVRTAVRDLRACKQGLTVSADQAVDQLRAVKEELEALIRQLDQRSRDEVDRVHREQQGRLDHLIDQCEEELGRLSGRLEKLDQLMDSVDDVEVLKLMEDVRRSRAPDQRTPYRDSLVPVRIDFRPNEGFTSAVRNLQRSREGEPTVTEGRMDERPGSSPASAPQRDGLRVGLEKCPPPKIAEIPVGGVSDVIVLPDDSVVVCGADGLRKFSSGGSQVGFVPLEGSCRMCVWSDREVVVTVVRGGGGRFVFVDHMEMRVNRRVETGRKYWGVCARGGTGLICSLPNRGDVLHVVSPDGRLLSSIDLRQEGRRRIIRYPCYLCLSGDEGDVLVSDVGTESLICSDVRGEVKFSYRGEGDTRLVCPLGVTVDGAGTIYLVDQVTDGPRSRLYRLTPGGQLRDTVMTSETGSWFCVGVNENGRLAIGGKGGVTVYQVWD